MLRVLVLACVFLLVAPGGGAARAPIADAESSADIVLPAVPRLTLARRAAQPERAIRAARSAVRGLVPGRVAGTEGELRRAARDREVPPFAADPGGGAGAAGHLPPGRLRPRVHSPPAGRAGLA